MNKILLLHPEIKDEWDSSKNGNINDFHGSLSKKRVWWICKLNACGCHLYEAPVNKGSSRNSNKHNYTCCKV